MGILANSVDPDEMPQNVAFHQGLHCLLRQNLSSEKEVQYSLEIITCDPSIYTLDHPDLTVLNFMGNFIGLNGGNCPENSRKMAPYFCLLQLRWEL